MQPVAKLSRSPLFATCTAQGGRFVPFAGWEMPVQFTGVMAEHLAVRQAVGLFDASHMGQLIVEGPQAAAALNFLVTHDPAALPVSRALYTVMCNAQGGIVDDLIIYRERADRFFLCVNASRRHADFLHLLHQTHAFACQVTDESDSWALLALQGPKAQATLDAVCKSSTAELPPFSFIDTLVADCPVRVATTGYTGEPGVELYVPAAQAQKVFWALQEAGAAHNLALCGLGARDTLRLEMKYPLYGSDLDTQHTPLEAGLGWTIRWHKDFIGRAALQAQKDAGVKQRWVGFRMLGHGIARPSYAMVVAAQQVGVVTSGTHSPSLGYAIGCGYVPTEYSSPGCTLQIMVRDKPVDAQVSRTPFYTKRSQ